ncbi:peroxiredoxin [Komagataeibacter intermedius]|uniref:thioredoxin-dependent peroxiredoxin n=2 Tax=Komagataeibacter intermedius TaxID=66229 RepID=A0A0N0MGI7_9PROT|nr:peroxiredoxin [Komagataeibacter intermedius]KPH88813.1 thioredoxin peroxidase [Komagataeibacter intermedius AF2]MCF3635293.1 peroxiredoxin [Komagataeibacter intermedius]GAN87130.1 thioredoxin peroxidase [Komagataeibacter intermedius TF2]GBQ67746.1 thioredoxin peroxidase [Komagataeibacter intermedius NRIC 0521]
MRYFYRRSRWSLPGLCLPLVGVMAFAGFVCFSPARAALPVGSQAPMFDAQATSNGSEFDFRLADALRQGPVVLYFYPAAFTRGCTMEAHDFANAMDQYKALGATVIGVSTDDMHTLDRFSVSEGHGRFPVATDPKGQIARMYDSHLPLVNRASRTSYVIAPDGKVIYAYSALSPKGHVSGTLDALKQWRAAQGNATRVTLPAKPE